MAGARLVHAAARLMGWAMLAVIGACISGLLWRIGLPRGLWAFVGSALMLGAAGYALQGEPALPGHPVKAGADPIEIDPDLIALRDAMMGRFTGDGAYLIAADGMTRVGDTGSAVQWVLAGINKYPQSYALWTGLGTALAAHDGGQVSPSALFAFQQAARLAPGQPAPPFFAGLAYIRAAEFANARPYWARAVALTPKTLSYYPELVKRLALLDRFLAAAERQQAVAR
ncbi:tetratricopeptide repeat protein [Sphingomonas sp. GB1N7]|uniref:tetratricopeptide repeat protein n=1 Tax=Parasphingomonas caseinilytica TaxID=3096158 RepID=UPI002FCA1366